ncbi:MAG: antibiotic biosynthesis monooxygenase, partial [Phycisphaerales bacterium]
MIQVVLRMTAEPRRAAEIVRALSSLSLGIRSTHGHIESHVYHDAEALDALCYIEEWAAPEDLTQATVIDHRSEERR